MPAADRPTPGPASRRVSEPARQGATLIDPQTLMRIKSLQVRARVAVEGFIKGLHRSPFHGFSVEFSEYREYSPGDDPRYLDWKLFARSDRYYVKRFEDETNLRCHLVLDTSRSMGYGTIGYRKIEYARTAAATRVSKASRSGGGSSCPAGEPCSTSDSSAFSQPKLRSRRASTLLLRRWRG